MFKTNIKRIMIFIVTLSVLGAIFAIGFTNKVVAIENGDVVAYPFASGNYALANAPTIKGHEAQSAGDVYQWNEQKFDANVDLTSAQYVAIEYQNTKGNPGLTLGIMSNGQRFGTYIDSKPIYFVNQNGVVSTLSVLYSSVNLGTEAGMIVIPVSSISLVGWGQAGSTLSSANSFFFETNAKCNYGFEMKIGEIAYTNDTDLANATWTKVLDLSTSVKKTQHYGSEVTATYPEEAVNTTVANYPFATGDYTLANAPTISGIATQSAGDAWCWHESVFDNSVNLLNSKYVAFEYQGVTGNPGLTLGVMSNGNRFGTYTDGKPIYFVKQSGEVQTLSVLYSAVNLGNEAGMVVIPLSSLSIVGWGDQTATLSNATSVFIETNGKYNWAFSFKIGEVAYANESKILGANWVKTLDLSTEIKKSKCSDSVFTNEFPAKATDTTKEPVVFEWPFSENSLKNAPTFKAQTAQTAGDTWQYAEVIFGNTDLRNAKYIAIHMSMTGNPGMTYGIIAGGSRYGVYSDGTDKAFLLDEEGTKTSLSGANGGYINVDNKTMMFVLPVASLSKVGWDTANGTFENATSFFFETNARYNWGFELTIGEIGYYEEDPLTGAEYHSLLDLSAKMNKASASASNYTIAWPESSSVGSILNVQSTYPFRTDEYKYENTVVWAGTAQSDSSDNWQTFIVNFDKAADLTKATYLAIHYNPKTGNPGITFGVQSKGTRYSIVGSSGEDLYVMNEEGLINKAVTIVYDAANINQAGMLLIPMKLLKYQFGSAENTLATANQLVLTTNSKYNWAFEIGVGAVGYYTGEPVDDNFEYHSLLDVSTNKDSKFTATSDLEANRSTKYSYKIERLAYGDTKLFFFATGKKAGQLIPWTGGANGEQTMTKDSYGDDALLLKCTGARENADAYTAFTIADGVHYDWSGAKGVTIWARNDSDVEISFNLEIDVLHPDTKARGRFNVTQGHRFWLYDVKTNKQQVYMTRPCITIPVGFEGWVRIPFECFEQASWSLTDANYGAFPRQYFMTEGSYVPYVGLTVYSGSYTGKEFAVNKIGCYSITPTLISALTPADSTKKTILELMGLAE